MQGEFSTNLYYAHSHMIRRSFNIGPFILTTLVSPLVLLRTTSMTKYHNFPPLSSLASYAIQGNFQSIIMPPEQMLQNALLRVIFNCCNRGSFELSDFTILRDAWNASGRQSFMFQPP